MTTLFQRGRRRSRIIAGVAGAGALAVTGLGAGALWLEQSHAETAESPAVAEAGAAAENHEASGGETEGPRGPRGHHDEDGDDAAFGMRESEETTGGEAGSSAQGDTVETDQAAPAAPSVRSGDGGSAHGSSHGS